MHICIYTLSFCFKVLRTWRATWGSASCPRILNLSPGAASNWTINLPISGRPALPPEPQPPPLSPRVWPSQQWTGYGITLRMLCFVQFTKKDSLTLFFTKKQTCAFPVAKKHLFMSFQHFYITYLASWGCWWAEGLRTLPCKSLFFFIFCSENGK